MNVLIEPVVEILNDRLRGERIMGGS